jgi:inhibitor of cysteine peptidase
MWISSRKDALYVIIVLERKMRNILILIAVIVLAAIACLAMVPVHITDSDNGKTIDVMRFRTIKLSLESNPTTGYTWQLISPDERRILRLYYSAYRATPTKLVGVGGHEEWKFRAMSPGTAIVKTIYIRSWEGQQLSDKSFTVTIRVK